MLHIGYAAASITPDRAVMLQGQKHVRIAREAMDELTVNAIAIDGGTDAGRAIIVSCDLAMVSPDLLKQTRERLASLLPQFPADNLILSATHTHTSLVYEDWGYQHPGGDVMTPEECRTFLVERISVAAAAAWQALAPATLARAWGHAVVGRNRRPTFNDGSTVMYGKANRPDFRWIEGCEDHSVDMVFTWDQDGALTGLLLLVPCPSQVDEGLSVMSADYWHEVRVELRKRLNPDLAVIGLCGAAGDMSPHFILDGKLEAEMRQRRAVTERQEIALRLADAVERALVCTAPLEDAVIVRHEAKTVALTPRSVSRAERDVAADIRAREVERFGAGSWWPRLLQQVVDTYEGRYTPPAVEAELHALRLADAVLVTNPFELFVDYGTRIRARSVAAQTLVAQLTCGRGLYLPTQRGVEGGGYGAMPAVCLAGPEGGAELVEHSLAMIESVMK